MIETHPQSRAVMDLYPPSLDAKIDGITSKPLLFPHPLLNGYPLNGWKESTLQQDFIPQNKQHANGTQEIQFMSQDWSLMWQQEGIGEFGTPTQGNFLGKRNTKNLTLCSEAELFSSEELFVSFQALGEQENRLILSYASGGWSPKLLLEGNCSKEADEELDLDELIDWSKQPFASKPTSP